MFKIDKKLKKNTFNICSLKLSELLLMNNKNYPWLILVPRTNSIEIIDLNEIQVRELYNEIKIASNILKFYYPECKLNIASIGNIVSQLHIHVIARHKNDIEWPNTVFGKEALLYSENERLIFIKQVREKLKCLD